MIAARLLLARSLTLSRVIDHVLAHPDPYQSTLPLRTIYTLNCQTTSTSPADFKQMLFDHLQNMPDQPCTLPPVFLTSFIKRCFPHSIEEVDFAQALTALDYLRDLEMRRHKELQKATRSRGALDPKISLLTEKYAETDRLYAKALAGIRRWVCFSAAHCLNTS